jgi:small-conductance mechanosensitive channel
VVSRLEKLAEKTETKIDDYIIILYKKVFAPLLYIGALYVALKHLAIQEAPRMIIDKACIVILTFFAVKAVILLIDFGITETVTKNDGDEAKTKSIKGLLVIVKGLVWAIGIILLLDNMGYKVSTILAGLGIGGIAIALAAQALLGDFFSYVSIIFDKPFQIGDFIVVDDHSGTIEHIGIKTTRMRSVDGEQIIFSNSGLTGTHIKNFKRMVSRRVVLTLGVTYETPVEKMKKIPELIKQAIMSVKGVKFDRAHFNSFSASSQDFEVVYIVEGNDYNKYMDIKQDINFKIIDEFNKLGIEFAYPTQTLFVKK